MKKFIFFICATSFLFSCSDNDVQENIQDSITGTSWIISNEESRSTLAFTTTTLGFYLVEDTNPNDNIIVINTQLNFTYDFNGQSGVITPNDEDASSKEFFIQGNNLTLIDGSEREIFLKQ